jgi:hypothetical protein
LHLRDAEVLGNGEEKQVEAHGGLVVEPNGVWSNSAVQRILGEASRRPEGITDFQFACDSPKQGRRIFRLSASRFDRGPQAGKMMVIALTDKMKGA